MRIQNNYIKIYRDKGFPDLSDDLIAIVSDYSFLSEFAKQKGRDKETVQLLNELDHISYSYRCHLIGYSTRATRLNKQVRAYIHKGYIPTRITLLFTIIHDIYSELVKKELYELIPEMILMNQRLFKIIQDELMPWDYHSGWFFSPNPVKMKTVCKQIVEEYRKKQVNN